MRARLTYKVNHWSEGAFIEPLPALRAKYGDVVADVVEVYAFILRSRGDRPRLQDVKRTLRTIFATPAAVPLDDLDEDTRALLLREAAQHHRDLVGPAIDLERLPLAARSSCADAALQRMPRGGGRPTTDPVTVLLVRELLHVRGKALPTDDRYALIADALEACGLKHGDDTVRRLLLKAGQVS